ncbi:MAG: biopolymer transporter ExbD [Sulfitobacter sp.]
MARTRKRRRLSMTSLIDVIFLLLLFFMLTSTFSKFAEVELAAGGSGSAAAPTSPPVFLQLAPSDLRVNGTAATLETLQATPIAELSEKTALIVSLAEAVDAQRLTDLLVSLRAFPLLSVTVLGG